MRPWPARKGVWRCCGQPSMARRDSCWTIASCVVRPRDQKESCIQGIHSLFRTHSCGRNHPPREPLPGASEITAEDLAKTCAELASNKKAEEIVVLDLRGISTFTDFFVICSATSEPHLKAIAGEVETKLKQDHSIRPIAVDGFPASQWMVLDYLQVVVHIFHRDKRAFYSL